MAGSLDQQFQKRLGQRLRIARKAAGLSMREVEKQLCAQRIPISHASISNYERGVSRPSEKVLESLAAIYKRSLDWIRGSTEVLTSVRYRALKSVSVTQRNDFTYRAQAWLEAYLYIEKKVGSTLKSSYPRLRIDYDESGRRLADRLRKLYKMSDHPVPSTIQILEDFGIYVIHLPTNARIDACAGWLGKSRAVVLNTNLSNDRTRLTAFHELAHHLYEDCVEGPSLPTEEVERRAFEFASHMLIPEGQLRKAFEPKSMVRLVKYKERFGISLAAMVYRARESGLLSQRLYQRLWRDFSRLGFRENEPGIVAADRPVRMESLFDIAVDNGAISYEDIAKIVGTDEHTVQARVIRAVGGVSNEASKEEAKTSTLNLEEYRRINDKNI